MRHATAITAALLLTGLAVGCSSGADEPAVSKATDTPSTASSSPSPSPSPSPETYKLGDTVNINADGKKFSGTALTYKDTNVPTPEGILNEGQKFATVEVKVCNRGSKTLGVSPFAWSLAYSDGARMEPMHVSGGGLPQPLYPLEAKVRDSDCVRGHILFEVPEKFSRAERVLYSPGDLDEPVEWAVPKA
ncbi:DUF4352 domain-containing protein [Streptomyces chartreusis]|uniref:DUF4352 domain-containing protein n=1 Tax=Streptomyces chartreusis TaxID=1969 RepID=UPI003D89C766